MMYLYNDDFDRARHYGACAVQTFLQDWSSMDTLQASSRAATLQRLQRLTELQEFLAFVGHQGTELRMRPCTRDHPPPTP